MLKVQLICCGNKMPPWVNDAIQGFSKRLKEFCQFSIIEIPLLKRSDEQQLSTILEKESLLILKAIPKQAYCIALDSRGKLFKSEGLANKLETLLMRESCWCFIIGGPEGLSQTVKDHCQESVSLSNLTFPHTLARILLCEALYRSFAIMHRLPYHK